MNEKKLLNSVASNVDSLFMIIAPKKSGREKRNRLKGKQTHEAIFSMKM
jgi:hypothetical protein